MNKEDSKNNTHHYMHLKYVPGPIVVAYAFNPSHLEAVSLITN